MLLLAHLNFVNCNNLKVIKNYTSENPKIVYYQIGNFYKFSMVTLTFPNGSIVMNWKTTRIFLTFHYTLCIGHKQNIKSISLILLMFDG